mgnify:CR=1 FL=1
MSDTKLVSVSHLKKGDTIVIDGVACKITDMSTSRPGKHGHAKINMMAVGLLDSKKRNLVIPGHDKVETPIIEKKTAQVLSIAGNTANVMDMETFETFDLAIPHDLQEAVQEGISVLYWSIVGDKVMKQVKTE